MARFVVRRLALLIPILIGLSILVFAWVRALPGGPAAALLGERATPEAVERINRLYGLDQPIVTQYLKFLRRAIVLDFGNSTQSGDTVMAEFVRRFPATIELAAGALLFAVAIGIPLGYFAARRYGSWLDNVSVAGSLLGVAIPVFFLGFILKYVFAVKLGWFPTVGRQDPRIDAEHPTNFYVFDAIITGNWAAFVDAVQHLVLPAIALGTIPLAIITRITRASVLDVQNEDYVRTGEAKGLLGRTLTRRYVLRNALLPVATIVGLQLGLLLSGAVLTETVFAWPGIGSFIYDAITVRDYAVVQGFILVLAIIFVIVNLLVDISYGLIDPRIRVGEVSG
jgi:peptide/nickel transport system permease protein